MAIIRNQFTNRTEFLTMLSGCCNRVKLFFLSLCLLLLNGFQIEATPAPVFPDFDLSLRRYSLSDAAYFDFFENLTQECYVNVIKNRQFKKFLASLYNSNKLKNSHPPMKEHIPKRVHQIWLGSPVPAMFQEWMRTWQGWEGWTYKLWTDADVKSFGLYNQKLYDNATNYGERSDILRYEILLREGGLYVDVDFQCLNPEFFNFAHENYDFYAGIEPLETTNLSVNNALVASAPGHPLLKAIIHDMADHHMKSHDPKLGEFSTIATTGPRYLTKQFKRKELHKGKTDIALPPTFFYPMIWDDLKMPRSEFAKFLKSESCAVHWWSGSWYKPEGKVKPR